MKFGVLIGRFQPFHKGHYLMVKEIVDKGYIPIIVVGSCGELGEKNPFSTGLRMTLISDALALEKNAIIISVKDYPESDSLWVKVVKQTALEAALLTKEPIEEIKFFGVRKDIDRNRFGRHYLDWFEAEELTYPQKEGVTISATDIRKDFEGNKEFLVGNTYELIKQWAEFGIVEWYNVG